MEFNGTEGELISLADAAQLTRNHRDAYPDATKGIFFGRNHIEALLQQDGSMGIRMYFGISENNNTLVLCSANASGDDQTDGIIANKGVLCPPNCSTENPLNTD